MATKPMATTLSDPIFGKLNKEELGLVRKYDIIIFGERKYVDLIVETDKDEPTPGQRETFSKFEMQKKSCIEYIEKAIYEYYSSILKDERSDLGSSADKMMPIVSDINGLKDLVFLDNILVLDPDIYGEKKMGFLFDCTWDPGHGLGVELTDNKVTAVDNQDILL